MKKIFKNLLMLTFAYFACTSIANSTKASGAATVLKITVTKIELCETGSTDTTCLNPITVSNPGLSTDVDLASITAGSVAATMGNFGRAKAGTSYTYIQAIMSRAIIVKGSATADGLTCHTKGDGNSNGTTYGIAETTAADSTEATLYVPAFTNPTDFPRVNSVGDREGSNPRTAGTVDGADSHFASRDPLTKPFILDPSAIPTVTMAFGTSTAVTVSDGRSCDGNARIYATPPDVTITIQGQ